MTRRRDRDVHQEFDGPLKNRSCTDIICLCMFLLFVAVWIGVGLYALTNGDPSNLLVPKDSKGRRCGKDSDVRDKPYLFFHDLSKCLEPSTPFLGCNTPQVCVDQCPSDFYSSSTNTELNTKYCVEGTSPLICPSWYVPSEPILNRCLYNVADRKRIPNKNIGMRQHDIAANNWKLKPIPMWLFLLTENTVAAFTENKNIQEVAENVVSDLITSWWKILIGLGLAFVACLIYILMLRWIAAPMIWFSIIGILVSLGAALYFSGKEFKRISEEYSSKTADYDKSSLKTKKDLWLALLIILSVVTLIILLMLIVLRKRIKLAIALVEEGSKAVTSVTASLLFPVIPWILQVGVIAYAVAVALFLATSGAPQYTIKTVPKDCTALTEGTACDPDKFASISNNLECENATCKFVSMKNEAYYPYLQAINVFGFFWLAFFVSALGEMVLAGVFAQWYWTFRKSQLPFFALTAALGRTLRYHIGTLAFGSLLIAICRIIRLILEYIDRKLKQYDNEITRAIMCCAKCIFWCLEKFIRFINRNAYIMCAIYGKNFCVSAKDAFSLLLKNILRVWVLDKVTDFLFFISSVLLTLGIGAVAYVIFATDLVSFIDNSTLHYGIVPVIVIMACTYLISTLFFSVYSMAVDTLFLCFLEDCERNDGTPQKPYYMSRNLMKIFGKKNKRE